MDSVEELGLAVGFGFFCGAVGASTVPVLLSFFSVVSLFVRFSGPRGVVDRRHHDAQDDEEYVRQLQGGQVQEDTARQRQFSLQGRRRRGGPGGESCRVVSLAALRRLVISPRLLSLVRKRVRVLGGLALVCYFVSSFTRHGSVCSPEGSLSVCHAGCPSSSPWTRDIRVPIVTNRPSLLFEL